MKQTMKIHLRRASPEDALFLAQAILMAGRAHVQKGIWEVILGGSEEECLDFLQHLTITRIPHLFQYTCYFIAERENEPVGTLGGYNPHVSGYQALQQVIPEVMRTLKLPPQGFQTLEQHASKILACLPSEIDGAWVIDSVATIPAYRGRGVAQHLLKAVLDEGKRQGHTIAQINMYIGNEPALNLYRKCGFTVIEERRDAYFEQNMGSPGMISLARPL
jgi:ribosomal protein S18 acetylase RimI-like enzyme